MENNIRILSTKLLEKSQREFLLNAGISLVEMDFISTSSIDFTADKHIENAIFTSKNSVNAILSKGIEITNCFCVGDKTEALLIDNGFQVVEKAYKADKLAELILNSHRDKEFTFFCGDKRREELPLLLKKDKVRFKEVEVYKTKLNPKMVAEGFDGILFFSPSAVQSYVLKNDFESTLAFCLGKTTEKEVKKHTNNIITANRPTIENVIVQVIKHFK